MAQTFDINLKQHKKGPRGILEDFVLFGLETPDQAIGALLALKVAGLYDIFSDLLRYACLIMSYNKKQ